MDEWQPDPDGVPAREAARVILLDDLGRVLLFEAVDPGDDAHRWWFTTGGGLLPGESPATGAARELFEETGVVVEPAALQGPVAYRVEDFHFNARTVRQREHYFVHRLAASVDLSDAHWTELERRTLLRHAWWTREDLRASRETIYPLDLLALLEGLDAGFDGRVRTIV